MQKVTRERVGEELDKMMGGMILQQFHKIVAERLFFRPKSSHVTPSTRRLIFVPSRLPHTAGNRIDRLIAAFVAVTRRGSRIYPSDLPSTRYGTFSTPADPPTNLIRTFFVPLSHSATVYGMRTYPLPWYNVRR